MRVLQFLTAALLPFSTLAAKKSTGDRFTTYHSRQLSNAAPLKLDDSFYTELTKAPRDYSVAVLLTALDARFTCQLCTDFQPEWDLLGKTWTRGDRQGESRLIFGTLDFMDGKQTFQSVGVAHGTVRDFRAMLILHSSCCKQPQCSYSSTQL